MTPGTGWKKLLFKILTGRVDENTSLKAYERFESFCRKCSTRDTEYCAELMSAAYSNYVYKSSFFKDYIDVDFEDTKLSRPNEDVQ